MNGMNGQNERAVHHIIFADSQCVLGGMCCKYRRGTFKTFADALCRNRGYAISLNIHVREYFVVFF